MVVNSKATNSDTKFLDSIITKVVENVMAKSDTRFDGVESRLKLLEKLVFNQKAPAVVKAAPAKAPVARKQAVSRPAAKAAPTNIATKRQTSKDLEVARIEAGEKLLKCTTCKGDGLWGVKKDGSMGECFDCFGNGKLTVTRANQLRASRLARQAS